MIVNDDVEEFLEHYGIKGMRWGVRKDRESTGKSLSDRKNAFSQRQTRIKGEAAAKYMARSAKLDIRASELSQQIDSLGRHQFYKRYNLSNKLAVTLNARDADVKRAEAAKTGRLTPTQKKVLAGAAIAVAIAGTAYYLKDSEGVDANIRRIMSERKHGSLFKINKDLADKTLSPDQVLSKVVKNINPNYAQTGGQMNCRRATFAYELRRRGYDVQATTSSIGLGQSESGLVNALIRGDKNMHFPQSLSTMSATTGNIRARPSAKDTRKYAASTAKLSDIKDLASVLSKQPNGARGEVVFNERTFSHSMAYEIFNGVPHVFDSQKGTKYSANDFLEIAKKWGTPKDIAVTRLDDVDIDLEFLGRWAKNTK